jgi:hypothetical protein
VGAKQLACIPASLQPGKIGFAPMLFPEWEVRSFRKS